MELDGDAEAFATHEVRLTDVEVRPVPGFAATGRSQTVLVDGRPHVTGEFVYVSDPTRDFILVTTDGVPSQVREGLWLPGLWSSILYHLAVGES